MARLWSPYLAVVHQGLERLGYAEFDRVGWRSAVVNSFVFFIPQLLMALTGDLVARAMKKGDRVAKGKLGIRDYLIIMCLFLKFDHVSPKRQ
jgi:hypothetical protein